MPRNFITTSSQYIDFPKIDTLVGTTYTTAQRFKITALQATQLGLANHRSTVDVNTVLFHFSILATGNGALRFVIQKDGTNFALVDSINIPSLGVWHTGIGTRNGDSIELFLNGVSEGTDTSPGAMGTIVSDDYKVGALDAGSGAQDFMNGDVADVAVWSVELTQEEINAYNSGVSPNLIRPDKLVSYIPLWGTTQEPDLGGFGGVGTLTNSPVISTTSPAVMPYKKRSVYNQSTGIKRKEIEHFYAEKLTDFTNASATFSKVLEIPASFFTPRGRYLIITQSQIGCDNTISLNGVQLSFNGDVVLGNNANLRFRSSTIDRRRLYYDLRVVTADEVPSAFGFAVNNASANTVRAQNTTLFAMRLDKHFKEGEDYHYREETAALYIEPLTNMNLLGVYANPFVNDSEEDYFVIGGTRYFSTSNAQRTFITLKDSLSTLSGGGVVLQNANTGDSNWYQVKDNVLSNIRVKYGMETKHGSAGQKGYTEFTSIFAFKLSSLADIIVDNFPGGSVAVPGADIYASMGSGSFTPAIGGAYIALFHQTTVLSSNSAVGNKRVSQRFQLNSVTTPDGYDTNQLCDVQGSDDSPGFAGYAYFPTLPKTLQTWDHDAKLAVADTGGSFIGRYQLMFSLTPLKRFKIEGFVTENNMPVSRTVRAFLSSTGEFLGEAVSHPDTGAYEVDNLPGGNIFVVAFDDAGGESFNAQVFDKIVPVD